MAKNNEIRIKVSPEEFDRLKRKAKALSIPIATYVRAVALRSEVIIE